MEMFQGELQWRFRRLHACRLSNYDVLAARRCATTRCQKIKMWNGSIYFLASPALHYYARFVHMLYIHHCIDRPMQYVRRTTKSVTLGVSVAADCGRIHKEVLRT